MTELLPLLAYSLVMSSTPGPNNIMLTASGANFGYRRSLPHILGIAAGHGPQIFFSCLGLGAVFAQHPALHGLLRMVGAACLAVLAWQLARSAAGRHELSRPLSFRQAVAFQAVNPKGWIKALTVATVFMPPDMGVASGAALVTAISIAINFPCVSMWALFGVAIRRALTDVRRQRAFNAIMAASLLALALTMLLCMFTLDRTSSVALAEQIETRLRALIAAGQLPAGTKLMSIRALAAQLGVSPNTVIAAYDRLVAAGLVDSRATAGFFVCESSAVPAIDTRLEAGEEQDAVWLVQQAHEQRAGVLPASSGALPVSWLEDAIPASVVQRGLARSTGGMASRCPPQGLPELRERLAMLMRGQGIAVDASRVMTNYGGTHAIDLICRAFLRAGDTVLVENPGYFLLLDRLRQAGVRIVPVARRPDGPDLDQLEAACLEHRPRLFFIQSVLHNPTGWGSSAAKLHRVLTLTERHGVLIAEDDVHGHFHPGPAARVAQLAELRGVIYYSSFCKVLSPALRLGYLAAEPALLKPLLREKIHSVLTTAALNEFVLLELLSSGRYRKHIERLQRKLGTARNAASRELRQAGILLERPAEGGLFLWGALPSGVDADVLVKDAYRHGILLAGGAAFAADGASDPHLRFNVVFSQHARLCNYLRDRLGALSLAHSALARAATKAPTLR